MRPQPLPGFVPSQSAPAVVPKASGPLRADFERELQNRITGWTGSAGSERSQALRPFIEGVLDASGERIDVNKLPDQARADLAKLEHAAEGIESIFVKQLLAQMRSTSFSNEGKSQMSSFIKDMMDQTIADQASHGQSSIGIAKMVFLDSAQTLVRAALSQRTTPKT